MDTNKLNIFLAEINANLAASIMVLALSTAVMAIGQESIAYSHSADQEYQASIANMRITRSHAHVAGIYTENPIFPISGMPSYLAK